MADGPVVFLRDSVQGSGSVPTFGLLLTPVRILVKRRVISTLVRFAGFSNFRFDLRTLLFERIYLIVEGVSKLNLLFRV